MNKCILFAIIVLLLILLLRKYKYTNHFWSDEIGENGTDNINFPISYVINLKKHENRRRSMIRQLRKQKMKYKIVNAVDKNSKDLPNFPCIDNSRPGTKAIQMSNIEVFKQVQRSKDTSEYFLMFEDDAEIPSEFKEDIINLIIKYPDIKVFNLDKRNNKKAYLPICKKTGYWGAHMVCMLIHKDIVKLLIKEMHPETSEYMNNYNNRGINKNKKCIHDLYVANLLDKYKISSMCVPLVRSDEFKTSIQNRKVGWKDN